MSALKVAEIEHLSCVYCAAPWGPQRGSQFDASTLILSTPPSHLSG